MSREEELAVMKRRVDASFEKDPERWKDSYIDHSASAIRKRVLAERNGHAGKQP